MHGRDAGKKNAFQRHKEDASLREQQAHEETSRVYQEFVASFEAKEYATGTTGFVKAASSSRGTGNSTFQPMTFVKAGGAQQAEAAAPSKRPYEKMSTISTLDDHVPPAEISNTGAPKGKKLRQMDTFLEELKRQQENRSKGMDISGGSDDRPSASDAHTTNLFLSDLSASVTEQQLCHTFGVYGPIASVKIMRPRADDPTDRKRICGFVSFMRRDHAAAALEHLDGTVLEGKTIKAGWGKPVPLPPVPYFMMPPKPAQPERRRFPFTAQLVPQANGRERPEINVRFPKNNRTVRIIHRMIERIVKYGPKFEGMIMRREHGNPQFRFLFDHTCDDHVYYRWRLYSIFQGDTPQAWQTEPFQMYDDGVWWIPPRIPDIPFDEDGPTDLSWDSDDEAAERGRLGLGKGQLGKIGRERYEVLLRQVTLQRGTIAKAMAFAIERADAHDDVIKLTVKAVVAPGASVTAKIARLFLVSDILHNSGVHVTNAWRYREGFAHHLPDIFAHLHDIYRSISARLKAEQFRRYVMTVLGAWETWMLFPKHEIERLKGIFTADASQKHAST
ncbi:hypothetical protein BC940DRAFT_312727 [Gongronella butleri]|nr:hypothetical protein BC940DRAFT_312727 [Gongronella butleri]